MTGNRPIHPELSELLRSYDPGVVEIFGALRNKVLLTYPECNELIYHTQVVGSVFSLTDELNNAFCYLPIYSRYAKIGFPMGTVLYDPDNLLEGEGKNNWYVTVKELDSFPEPYVMELLRQSYEMAWRDMEGERSLVMGRTISRIKKAPERTKDTA